MDEEPWDEGRPSMPTGSPPAPPTTRDPPAFRQTKSFTRTLSTGPSTAPPSSAFNAGLPTAKEHLDEDEDDEDEEDSIDEDIGREYDNNRIRQEALRMLEVADSPTNNKGSYSVHRTVTGGFTAQPRELGQQRGRAALTGLNFVASRNNVGKRFADFAVAEAEGVSRDDYEYGDDSVVDVIGLQNRSAETERASSKNWSSRYSIDKTVLAMSGGAMRKNKRDHTDPERLSALNLFHSSPAKSTQVFGSGFSFRQKHVFGKQNATIPTDNLRNLHSNEGPLKPNVQIKTWQEQIHNKRQRQRFMILAVVVALMTLLVPTVSVFGVHKARQFPADGKQGSVTFSVFGNGPFGGAEEVTKKLATVAEKSSFAVHLGNFHDIASSSCTEETYDDMAEFLHSVSSETLFVVPGHEDWNECAQPSLAWDNWASSFLYFDRWWNAIDDDLEKNPFLVYRQKNQRENWAFVHSGVLFLGVHVVNGFVPSQEEFTFRNQLNYNWVYGMSQEHADEIRAIVIFGNGMPGLPQNIEFFAPLEEYWRTLEWPGMYVHLNNGEIPQEDISEAYHPFDDLPHFMATRVQSQDWDEPLLINVGKGDTPFRLS